MWKYFPSMLRWQYQTLRLFGYSTHIGGVMLTVLTSSANESVFEPWSSKAKNHKLVEYAALMSRKKDW